MDHLYVNLKRFDISPRRGGVNRLAPMDQWAATIIRQVESGFTFTSQTDVTFFFPEAHLIPAVAAAKKIHVGAQGVLGLDTEAGGNFGAFTTSLTANAAVDLGCRAVMIGHGEQRAKERALLEAAGVEAEDAISRTLNKEVLAAQKAGLDVLFCIGESAAQRPKWQSVLQTQLEIGLAGADLKKVVIAYEPLWSIGPGKIPASPDEIREAAVKIKQVIPVPVVYGGGLKKTNAAAIARIAQIDGGLIALTRFEGEIGFYPDEFLEIMQDYQEARK